MAVLPRVSSLRSPLDVEIDLKVANRPPVYVFVAPGDRRSESSNQDCATGHHAVDSGLQKCSVMAFWGLP